MPHFAHQQPITDSFKRARHHAQEHSGTANLSSASPGSGPKPSGDFNDETFMTSDTSFVTNTPASRLPTKFANPAPAAGQRPPSGQGNRGGAAAGRAGRGGIGSGVGRGAGGAAGGRGGRGSGIARGKPRGGVR